MTYKPAKFGSFRELKIRAGYDKLSKILDNDSDIREALKDLLYYEKK